MKSGFLFLVVLVLSTSAISVRARADDLLANACVDGSVVVRSATFEGLIVPAAYPDVDFSSSREYAMNFPTVSCHELKSAKEAIEMAGIALMPAKAAMKLPGVGAAIDASIEALGLLNPAVIGVTVVGATGVAVVYIVLKRSVSDCERQDREDFKQQVFHELEGKYGIHALPSQQIQYQRN